MTGSSGDVTLNVPTLNKDLIFKIGNSTSEVEVCRIDGSANSLLMSGSAKIEFRDSNAYIHHDDTDLKIYDDADINLVAGTDILLDATETIKLDSASGDISFLDAGTAQLAIDMDSTAGQIDVQLKVDSDDLVFKQYDGNEVIRIADDRKLYFYHQGGEHIYSDGTDMTVASGAKINLSATTDVVIPSGVGLILDGSGDEKIESDGTDISFSVGTGGDINIPANIGLTFGDDGEKIEGDGTNLTLTSGNELRLDAAADVVLDAGGSDVWLKNDGTTNLRVNMSSSRVAFSPWISGQAVSYTHLTLPTILLV